MTTDANSFKFVKIRVRKKKRGVSHIRASGYQFLKFLKFLII